MKSRIFARKPVALALGCALVSASVWAQEVAEPVTVEVNATRLNPDAVLEGRALELKRAANSDTASLLTGMAGYAVRGAGAIANLPVIRGLADDRLTIKVDGVDAIASCPNHMNSPLSYVDPTAIEDIKVYKSITPVSVGGNSIGGAIVVDTSRPVFSDDGSLQTSGQIGTSYYSNGDGTSGNLSATAATDRMSVNYTGSTSSANNYQAARNFTNGQTTPKTLNGTNQLGNNVVGSSAFMTTNQAASLALKLTDSHALQFQYSTQSTPFEGFSNQYMDMTGNNQSRMNLRYWGGYDWGNLEAQAYQESINHTMQFGPNRQYWYGANANIAGMPMNTNSNTTGAKVKASIDLGPLSVLRTGLEYQYYYLNDWWPPVANSSMMSPNTLKNINGGTQQTGTLYTEWEKQFDEKLKTTLGLRYDMVASSTGQVAGYNTMATYATPANNFNSGNRSQTNNNIGVSAITNYVIDPNQSSEIALARQVRNPSLYELYAWATDTMSAPMNNASGDGNGYVGNQNLKPETAYTLAGHYDLHSADRDWQAKFAPYYSYVVNYIDAVQCNTSTKLCVQKSPNNLTSGAFTVMQYVNQNAQLAGADLTGRMPLGKNDLGAFGLKGLLSYTWGKNQETGDGLYNIMPLNGKMTLTQQAGGWDNALELVAVAAKTRTSIERNEMQTPGYFLTNIKGSYTWQKVRLDAGINNVFNTFYYLPLGGAYIGHGATMSMNSGGAIWGTPMPGPGISIFSALTVKF